VLELDLGTGAGAPRSFLFVGAHCDDIEIGCGATVRKLVARYPDAEYSWVVLTSDPVRAEEAHASARSLLTGATATTNVEVKDFRDGFLPYSGSEVKEYFEILKRELAPELVFTHYRLDAHQDHRLTAELTWNTFRDHFILEYEIPKFDGDLGAPNVFVAVSETEGAEKIQMLMENFPSQRSQGWFDEATFQGLMRLRGIECNAADGLAEAFYSRKAIIRP
jgi:LmbE family N-acetylglucosaminyl deacetylase